MLIPMLIQCGSYGLLVCMVCSGEDCSGCQSAAPVSATRGSLAAEAPL